MKDLNRGVFLALDVGTARTGLAVCDSLGITVRPLDYIATESRDKDTDKVVRIIENLKPEGVVVGIPVNMNGTYGPMSQKARKFIDVLSQKIDIPIGTVDERLTTAEAQRILISADVSRKRRKEVIDGMSACIILQKFLDQRRKAQDSNEDS